jgi:trigger factor
MEDVRKGIRAEIEQTRTQEYDDKYLETLIDTIISQSTVKYPPQLLKDEVDHLLEHFKEDLTEQKLDMDTYLKTRQLDQDTFIAQEINPVAVKRLLRRLVIDKISREEGIKLNIEELKTNVSATMTQLQNKPDYKNYQKRGQVENLVNAVTLDAAGRLINRDTLGRLKTIAKGEFKPEVVVDPESAVESEVEQVAPAEESATEPTASKVEAEPLPESTQTPPAEETPSTSEETKTSESPSAE